MSFVKGSLKKFFRFFKRNPFKILFVIFFFSLTAYVVMGTLTDDSTKAQEKEFDPNAKGDKPLSIDVDVVLVKKEEVQTIKELPGRVAALNFAQVKSQIDGVIQKVFFAEGSYVEQGQQLYQIDSAPYEAELSKAKANYNFLRKKKYRYSKLLKIGAVSKQEFDEVASAYVVASQTLEQAKINLDYTKVYAPISGHIGVSYFTKGALVKKAESDVLSVINQIDPVFIDVRYPASELGIIRQHLNCKVKIEVNDSQIIENGVIDSYERQIDKSSDSFLVRVRIDNNDSLLIPGMYVGAKFILESSSGLTIPIKSTYRDVDGSLFVWYVNSENIVSKKTIVANRVFGNSWVIEAGLSANDTVIYEGVQKIYEGALVNPNVAREVK